MPHPDDFEMSPLGRRLMEIRKKSIAEGGKLLTPEELEGEIAERRGGVYAREYEDAKTKTSHVRQ